MIVPPQRGATSDEVSLLHDHAKLVTEFVDLLADDAGRGRLFGLVERFNEHKLEQKLRSWIGRGENLPITAD
ncbi:MAG: hypothetical protein ACREUU_14440, partial [Gammaproteobacteria bacterium]